MKISRENISIVTMPYWHHTLNYGMESIRSCGFRNIEFWAASPHYCYTDCIPEERKFRKQYIISLMDAHGLKMPVLYPEQIERYAFINIASSDEEIQKNSMKIMAEYMEDAVEFGAESMALSAGWQHMDTPEQENYHRSVMAVKKLSERAGELGLTLLIEPGNRITGTFIWNLGALRHFLEDVNMPNVKACLNTVVSMDGEASLKEWLNELEGRIGHIHFADAGGKTLGDGSADIERQLHLLEMLDYEGMVSLNITFRDCCINPDRAVFKSAKWLERNGFLETGC